MLDYLSPDCELDLTGTARLAGRSEPYRGHEGLREYFPTSTGCGRSSSCTPTDFRIIPGSVIVIGHVTGKRDGLDVRRSSVWTWRVANGRATSVKVADLGDLAGTGRPVDRLRAGHREAADPQLPRRRRYTPGTPARSKTLTPETL